MRHVCTSLLFIMIHVSSRIVSPFLFQQQTQFQPFRRPFTIRRRLRCRRLSSSSQNHHHNKVNNSIYYEEKQSKSIIEKYKISPPKDLYRPYFPIYYNDVYEVPLPPKHRFPMSKYRQVRERVQQSIQNTSSSSHTTTADRFQKENQHSVQTEFIVSPLISQKDLETTHCPKYIQRYLLGDQTDDELRNVGFPWSLEGVNRSLSSTGGTVAAAVSLCLAKKEQGRILKKEGQQNHKNNCIDNHGDQKKEYERLSKKKFGSLFAAHIAGGTHHAFHDRGEGFSVFSDIAVAANVVLRDFPDVVKRVLIIDLDVHQGNGNAVLFQNDPRVFTFSMHCKGNYFSPKEDSDLDIELPINCNDATYLSTLNHWLKRIKNEGKDFDLIFYQAGVDIIDHDRLGRMNVTGNGVKRRNQMIYDLVLDMDVPLVISMGGGYPRKDWEPILNAHADVYIDAFERIRGTSL